MYGYLKFQLGGECVVKLCSGLEGEGLSISMRAG